ncbi:MAG: S8 family serine peptidase [Chloroflexota bacterium]
MILVLAPLPVIAAPAQPLEPDSAGSERLILRAAGDVGWPEISALLAETDAQVIRSAKGWPGVYTATYDSAAAASDALGELQGHSSFEWVEADKMAHYSHRPNDPLFSEQVWAESVDLPGAWNITTGTDDLVVAVVDSGVRDSHPDLSGKLLPGYDFLNDDATPEDDVGHGTAVAGIIGARGNDDVGIAGVAMDVRLLPVKVGSVDGAPVSALAAGVVWAVDQGADIINLSLVADEPSDALLDAVRYAYDQNIPVVTATGNEPEAITYPGAYEETISIGASSPWGTVAGFSSVENRVDLIAPGSSVLAPWWSEAEGDTWQTVSGTSFAAPIATGAAALLKSIDGSLSIEDLRDLLRQTAVPIDAEEAPVPGSGAGQLDVGASVQAALDRGFERVWGPVDRPVASGLVDRSWIWGSAPIATGFEQYADSARGERSVRYYDKARMEITHPTDEFANPWYVTSGLLVNEMVSGRAQIGDDDFIYRGPADVVIAGDPNDPLAPTYSDLRDILDAAPLEEGQPISQTLDAFGRVDQDDRFLEYDVTATSYIPETNHRIASVFWEYLNREGLMVRDDQLTTGRLFEPQFFVTGLPITEAYWTRARVDDQRVDVLVQCFERRCLTYTPSNIPQWQVEMGNVGEHYYRWRYQSDEDDLPPRLRDS